MTENEIGKIVVDCSYKIHVKLGSGLLESIYENCLAYELMNRGLTVQRQVSVKITGLVNNLED